MEVKTKYNIGDKFWVMYENKVYEAVVKSINVTAYETKVQIAYNGNPIEQNRHDTFYPYTSEEAFHPTKESLLASL